MQNVRTIEGYGRLQAADPTVMLLAMLLSNLSKVTDVVWQLALYALELCEVS